MQFAVTADLHLTTRARGPGRYAALEDILQQLRRLQVQTLVIAGDLFDAGFDNFADFEQVCRQPENRATRILVIPGNHDPNLRPEGFASENVRIITRPELLSLEEGGPPLLFIPYAAGQPMGRAIAEFKEQLPPEGWFLVGHGDWMGNLQQANAYEKGFYMPLSQRDLNLYRPAKVFLGHIHGRYDGTKVVYPGSPCGMDITETGYRSFVICDDRLASVEFRRVAPQTLFFNGVFTVFPLEDEAEALAGALRRWVDSWGLDPADREKARVRVKLNGYAIDKGRLKQAALEALAGLALDDEPDLSAVSLTGDPGRGQVMKLVQARLAQLDWPAGEDEPGRDEILLSAARIVYGGGA